MPLQGRTKDRREQPALSALAAPRASAAGRNQVRVLGATLPAPRRSQRAFRDDPRFSRPPTAQRGVHGVRALLTTVCLAPKGRSGVAVTTGHTCTWVAVAAVASVIPPARPGCALSQPPPARQPWFGCYFPQFLMGWERP